MDLALPDPDIFDFDDARRSALYERLNEADFLGLAIAAPRVVILGPDGRLPIVLVSSVTALDHWRLDLPAATALLAIERGGDRWWSGAALPPPPGRDESDRMWGPPPEGVDAAAIYTEAPVIDARDVLRIPMRPMTLELFAIGFDRISGAARVAVIGDDAGAAAHEVAGPALPAIPGVQLGAGPDAASPVPGALAVRREDRADGPRIHVAATGPHLTVLVAQPRVRELVAYRSALDGQPHAAFDVDALVPADTRRDAVCLYLVSGGAIAGPVLAG